MNKKYELVEDDFILHKGRKLYRIRALRKFFANRRTTLMIDIGDLGGYVGGYHNLSQEGTCWISYDAIVYDNARVEDDAAIFKGGEVFGNARVKGTALIYESSQIYGNAVVKGGTKVKSSQIYGNAKIENITAVYDNARVYGNTTARGYNWIESSQVYCNAVIEDSRINIASKVYDNAVIESISLLSNVTICGNNKIHKEYE